jgi:LacI family repressor for deo operon, udp, cdd, tsx, nupC, and nupG
VNSTKGNSGDAGAPRVRLADVARSVGLNRSTVSRALSNPDRVNPETRKLVQEAARRMGYTFNHSARSLSNGRTETILVAVPSRGQQSISPVVIDVLRGVFDEANRQSYGVLIREANPGDVSSRAYCALPGGIADGILSISGTAQHMRHTGLTVESAGLPIVSLLTNHVSRQIPSIVAAEEQGLYELTSYLIDAGHRKLAYVSCAPDSEHDVPRYRGFCRRLAESGLEDDHVAFMGGRLDFPGGVVAAESFLALSERPTAVACVSDEVAMGFIRRVKDAGLQVPDDVAVAGYDDLAGAAYNCPSLTTVSQPTYEIGVAGARLLIDICTGLTSASPQLVIMPTTLVRRESA